MSQNDDMDAEQEAALWAAGALTAAEYDAVRRNLETDPALARVAEEWERALAPIAAALSPIEPPAGILAATEARLDAKTWAVPGSFTVRPSEGTWVEIGPGIRIKVLHRDPVRRRQIILLEAGAGSVHPAHVHDFDEEIYVISGDLMIDGEELGSGDFHFSPRGSRHPMETTRKGCQCVITVGF